MSPAATRALVTGGAGFIGRHVAAALHAAGVAVRVLDTDPGAAAALPPEVERVTASVLDPAAVETAATGCGVVVHLAAVTDLWRRDPGEFERVNHGGTETVAIAARGAGARLIHVSSLLVAIGRSAVDGTRIDESAWPAEAELTGPYARAKHRAEATVRRLAADGLAAVIVRPTLPVGPGDSHLTGPTGMIRNLLLGATPALPRATLNLVDARDVAAAVVAAAERPHAVGETYILNGATVTTDAFLAALAHASGVAMPRRRVPYRLALLAAMVDENLISRLTARPPTAPVSGVRALRHRLVFDAGKAERELGFHARPLARSLADEVAWLRAEGLADRARPR